MSEALHFHDFEFDQAEHQLEPDDRVAATYLVTNQSDWAELFNINIVHLDRTDLEGHVVVNSDPATLKIAGPLGPREQHQVSVMLTTAGELPGRHALRVRATYECRPVHRPVEALFEFTVTAD